MDYYWPSAFVQFIYLCLIFEKYMEFIENTIYFEAGAIGGGLACAALTFSSMEYNSWNFGL